MLHLFDLKTILFAKHAQHIVLIHFPIALFLVSAVADIAGKFGRSERLLTVARFNLSAAAVMSLAAIATGLLAWNFIYGFTEPAPRLLLYHMTGGIATCALLWTLLLLRRRIPAGPVSWGYLFLTIITACLIMATAYLGGILSGVTVIGE